MTNNYGARRDSALDQNPAIENKAVYISTSDTALAGSVKVNHADANLSKSSVLLSEPSITFLSERIGGGNVIHMGAQHNVVPVEVSAILDKMGIRAVSFFATGKQIKEVYITEIGEVSDKIVIVRQTTLRNVFIQKIGYQFSKNWIAEMPEGLIFTLELIAQEIEMKRNVFDSTLNAQGNEVTTYSTVTRAVEAG